MKFPKELFSHHRKLTVSSVPEGADGYLLAQLATEFKSEYPMDLVFVARDAQHMQTITDSIKFFDSRVDVVQYPAWDCLPYDRVSPNSRVISARINLLGRMASGRLSDNPVILVTSVNAILQRIPTKDWINYRVMRLVPGQTVEMDFVVQWLEQNGFLRSGTVREAGEYAVRGGIIDLYASGNPHPIRLDFFGDSLETIRIFEADTQRTSGTLEILELTPVSEMALSDESIARFRQNYTAEFGASTQDDILYQTVSEGRRYSGMEHWLPFFHDELVTPFDYFSGAPIVLDYQIESVVDARIELIEDHYTARKEHEHLNQSTETVPYNPVPPELIYLSKNEWLEQLKVHSVMTLTPFLAPDSDDNVLDLGGEIGRSFIAERTTENVNVFDAVLKHIADIRKQKKRILIACWSEGARERLLQVLTDHGLKNGVTVNSYHEMIGLGANYTAFGLLSIESGFEIDKLVVIGEQDILGDRLVRKRRKERKATDILTEVSSLNEGDLVIHIEHGIGKFLGLRTIEAAGAPHDCLELQYHGGDKLFLPVENIDLLTKYSAEPTEGQLDRLGSSFWQARKARVKSRIRDLAEALIKTAAARATKKAPPIPVPEGVYHEFAARFPFEETEDQLNTIEKVFEDLGKGQPMDRLVCGDVGFGKTEVALRASFVTAFSGRQVAVVVPTTLLARQHYKTFTERFKGLPIRISHISRLVTTKQINVAKEEMANGTTDIVIGTHALLGKSINFRDLGLLVVDEEQHFGVKHKERLKQLKSDVHVLTLTATPIPRTLQLALTGVRELSLIATPPIDRLSIRTFISPFDPLVVREALLRERFRGGQSFYVCPRIADIDDVSKFLEEQVPELKVAVAHGRLPAGELDDIMNAFYDGKYDVLLSTTIVESGLDIPTVNTLIVHRSDRFGLSQLYQLRGRVGRSKVRAYALFTVPANKRLTQSAEQRLKVLQSLEGLGAGFQLATHDMDIRGSGNLLGEEQSGQIREVGVELYQQMLEEAVAQLKEGGEEKTDELWSPQISIGTPVLIPDYYVPDLQVRLSLYRRLGDLTEDEAIDAFGEELIDRFGRLPVEVEYLLKIVHIKGYCKKANVEKIDAGVKGVVVTFRNNEFSNPTGLIQYVASEEAEVKLRSDQKLVFKRDWPEPQQRLAETGKILNRLSIIAGNVSAKHH